MSVCVRVGIIPWGDNVGEIEEMGRTAIKQIRTSVRTPLVSLLLRGVCVCSPATHCSECKCKVCEYLELVTASLLLDECNHCWQAEQSCACVVCCVVYLETGTT